MVDQVLQSYADVAIPALNIQPGYFTAGRLSFLGMKVDVSFQLQPTGLDFTGHFNADEFSRVSPFYKSHELYFA